MLWRLPTTLCWAVCPLLVQLKGFKHVCTTQIISIHVMTWRGGVTACMMMTTSHFKKLSVHVFRCLFPRSKEHTFLDLWDTWCVGGGGETLAVMSQQWLRLSSYRTRSVGWNRPLRCWCWRCWGCCCPPRPAGGAGGSQTPALWRRSRTSWNTTTQISAKGERFSESAHASFIQ